MFSRLNHSINTALALSCMWVAERLVRAASWLVGWDTLESWGAVKMVEDDER